MFLKLHYSIYSDGVWQKNSQKVDVNEQIIERLKEGYNPQRAQEKLKGTVKFKAIEKLGIKECDLQVDEVYPI